MGSLKEEALHKHNEDAKTFDLHDDEMGYIRLLHMALSFHTLNQKIISGFLYYVATHRLGYSEGTNLMFKMDLAKEDNKLVVEIVPDEQQPPATKTQ